MVVVEGRREGEEGRRKKAVEECCGVSSSDRYISIYMFMYMYMYVSISV